MSSVNSGPHPEVYIRDGYPEVGAVADILYWILTSTQQGSWLTKADTDQRSRMVLHTYQGALPQSCLSHRGYHEWHMDQQCSSRVGRSKDRRTAGMR